MKEEKNAYIRNITTYVIKATRWIFIRTNKRGRSGASSTSCAGTRHRWKLRRAFVDKRVFEKFPRDTIRYQGDINIEKYFATSSSQLTDRDQNTKDSIPPFNRRFRGVLFALWIYVLRVYLLHTPSPAAPPYQLHPRIPFYGPINKNFQRRKFTRRVLLPNNVRRNHVRNVELIKIFSLANLRVILPLSF